MILKCVCNNCPGHIEFDEKDAGQTVICPHCGIETLLFIPKNVLETNTPSPVTASATPPSPAAQHSSNLGTCGDCGGKISIQAGICPHCGAPNIKRDVKQTHWTTGRVILLSVFIVAVLATLLFIILAGGLRAFDVG